MLSFQPSSRVLSSISGVLARQVRIFPLSSMVGTNVTVLVVVLPSGLVCSTDTQQPPSPFFLRERSNTNFCKGFTMMDLTFSQRWLWRVVSSGIQHGVVRCKLTFNGLRGVISQKIQLSDLHWNSYSFSLYCEASKNYELIENKWLIHLYA
jgi:hypothetical protein